MATSSPNIVPPALTPTPPAQTLTQTPITTTSYATTTLYRPGTTATQVSALTAAIIGSILGASFILSATAAGVLFVLWRRERRKRLALLSGSGRGGSEGDGGNHYRHLSTSSDSFLSFFRLRRETQVRNIH